MNICINNDWNNFFASEQNSSYFTELMERVEKDYTDNIVFPRQEDVFNAFKSTPVSNIKVVILGQDPYFNKGEAHGYAFSVPEGVKIPPSLKNIYKELENDLGIPINESGNLLKWSEQGVFLLNTYLTVIEKKPLSHSDIGWGIFTDNVLKYINEYCEHVVFILWGNKAIAKKKFIDQEKHLILESVHPSPLSSYRGFFDSKPFSKSNKFLIENGVEEVDWSL